MYYSSVHVADSITIHCPLIIDRYCYHMSIYPITLFHQLVELNNFEYTDGKVEDELYFA